MIPSDRPDGQEQTVDEWSIVRFDGREEVITMRLESSAAFDQAALIMPVPTRARFALGHDAVFDDMAERTKPRVEHRKRHVLFGGDGIGGGSSDEGATAAGAGAVEVVDAQDLGPLRVVTLRGDDAAAVGTWLDDQGFPTPEGLEPIAQEYLDDGWLLVAVRLRGVDGEEVQKLQPLIISFASDEVVYPLEMSELASAPTSARVDVVAPEPLAVEGRDWPQPDLGVGSPVTGRLYAGPMPNDQYLTSFQFAIRSRSFDDPKFVSTERDDYRQVIVEYEDVDITGRVFGGVALALLLAAALVIVLVRRRRRG